MKTKITKASMGGYVITISMVCLIICVITLLVPYIIVYESEGRLRSDEKVYLVLKISHASCQASGIVCFIIGILALVADLFKEDKLGKHIIIMFLIFIPIILFMEFMIFIELQT